MASSEVDICNIALGYLGASRIADLSESDECKLNYPICRDSCLEDVDWSFASSRFILSAHAQVGPEFGYTYRFLTPSNVLRVISVNGNLSSSPWVLEGEYILSDEASLEVVAIIRVTDVRVFSRSFVGMLAARLAAAIALPLTNSKPMAEAMWSMYSVLKVAAQANDGRQGTSKRMTRPSFRMRDTL